MKRIKSDGLLGALVLLYFSGFIALGVVTKNPQVGFYAGFVGFLIVCVALWDNRRPFSRLGDRGILWRGRIRRYQ